jgi:heptosyltransferase-2
LNSKPYKILVIGPAWVGDMVMAQALFKLLKSQNPAVSIDVLAPDWSRPLLERMPEVNNAIPMPIGHSEIRLKLRYQIGKQLRCQNYHQAIVIPNSFKSALIPFFAKIPKRTGWCRELRSILLTDARSLDKKQWPLIVQSYLALGLAKNQSLPVAWAKPLLEVGYDRLNQVREQYGLLADEAPVLAICPGAEFGPAKRWPAAYYAEVANFFLRQDWQVWIFGSPKDSEVAAEIQAITHERSRDLTGRTSLASAIDLLSLAKLVISNDSGLMHIAAALRIPQIAIYGPTPPDIAPPLNEHYKILYLDAACSPCFQRQCPLTNNIHQCMQGLQPKQVLQAAQELLSAQQLNLAEPLQINSEEYS